MPQLPTSQPSRKARSSARPCLSFRIQSALAAACLLSLPLAAATPSYNVINLGELGDSHDYSFAGGINDAGEVVGWTGRNGYSSFRATFFGSTAGNTENINLGGLEGPHSYALGINNNRQIVGVSELSTGRRAATLFSASSGDSGNIDLGTYVDVSNPDGWNTYATAINNNGQIAGSWQGPGGYLAGRFSPDSSNENNIRLGSLTIGSDVGWSGKAQGINEQGNIVGWAQPHGWATHPTQFSPTLLNEEENSFNDGNISLGDPNGGAYGINDAGQIVGYRDVALSSPVPYIFKVTDGISSAQALPSPIGARGEAIGINNFDQIAGNLNNAGVLWQNQNETPVFLDAIVNGAASNIRIVEGGGGIGSRMINDWGQIAVTGDIAGEGTRALLLNPTTPNARATEDGGWNTKFVAGMDYSLFTEQPGGTLPTTVDLLGGKTGSGGSEAYGYNRDVTVAFENISLTLDGVTQLSNVISLTGTGNDVFVLSLTYNEVALAALGEDAIASIYWLDSSGWKLAVDGNTGGLANATPFAGSFEDFLTANEDSNLETLLGSYGFAEGTAWAVLNHNSDFGVGGSISDIAAVPEPGSAVALAVLLTTSISLHRRRKKVS